jgi:HK97 family phage major capsid protein
MEISELKAVFDEQGKLWKEYTDTINARVDRIQETVDRAYKRSLRPGGSPSGEGAAISMRPDEAKALDTALRAWVRGDQPGVDRALAEYRSLAEMKTGRAGIDPDGGYVVGVDAMPLFSRMAEVSPLVRAVNTVTLRDGAAALEGVLDLQQFAASWVSEEASRPETSSGSLGAQRIELHEMYAMPSFTQKLLDCADIDVVQWATMRIAEAFAVKEEAAIVTGSGIGQSRGFTTYTTDPADDSNRSWGTFQHVKSGANGSFAGSNPADPLIDLAYSLRSQYLSNAVWVMSRSTAAKIRQFKEATTNAYLWQPGLQAGQPDRLLGYPVMFCEAMPALATGSLSVAFGDLRAAYTRIDKPGLRLITDPFTDKPRVRLYAYQRVGGDAVNFDALKLLKFAA